MNKKTKIIIVICLLLAVVIALIVILPQPSLTLAISKQEEFEQTDCDTFMINNKSFLVDDVMNRSWASGQLASQKVYLSSSLELLIPSYDYASSLKKGLAFLTRTSGYKGNTKSLSSSLARVKSTLSVAKEYYENTLVSYVTNTASPSGENMSNLVTIYFEKYNNFLSACTDYYYAIFSIYAESTKVAFEITNLHQFQAKSLAVWIKTSASSLLESGSAEGTDIYGQFADKSFATTAFGQNDAVYESVKDVDIQNLFTKVTAGSALPELTATQKNFFGLV